MTEVTLTPSVGQAEPYIWYWYDVPGTTFHVAGWGETAKGAKRRFLECRERLECYLAEKKLAPSLKNTAFVFLGL